MPSVVALFSGGLDSLLAIRIMQEQGIEVEALNIRTTFDCCKLPSAKSAADLGVRLTVLAVADDYLDLIRNPRYGFGRGMNPCVDCRIYMCMMAKRVMDQTGSCAVISGEVLGQRPKSQKRQQLGIIERDSGLKGRLLRPLSAKLLPPTIPEEEGLIDRRRLYDCKGRGRGRLLELAEELGLGETPQPSTGCPLTEVTFAPRVVDLLDHNPAATRWEFELLNTGRHFRVDEQVKIVVGRDQAENAALDQFFLRSDAVSPVLLVPKNFAGPSAMVCGETSEIAIRFAAALILRYTRGFGPANARICVSQAAETHMIDARRDPTAKTLASL